MQAKIDSSTESHAMLGDRGQLSLFGDASLEDPAYLSQQLITYIGNKRSLLPRISSAVEQVKKRLKKDKLATLDAFSGSGVVSRFFKGHSTTLHSNDLEGYAEVVGSCYLTNRSTVDQGELERVVRELNRQVDTCDFARGFIEELYSPADENNITRDDRVFYTKENARRLDNYRRLLDEQPERLKRLLLGPLLSKASVHANTAGVFKGFYKNRETQVGQYGGTGADALVRIKGRITLECPILSRFECRSVVTKRDANSLANEVRDLDLAYFDPPYNQHPYGSNYFMLNLLVDYQRPSEISQVSGIPTDWKRSDYNVRGKSLSRLTELLERTDSRFLLISFNDEGFIPPAEMKSMLDRLGRVEVMEIQYNTFRGSRNLSGRATHVTEQLFLVERN